MRQSQKDKRALKIKNMNLTEQVSDVLRSLNKQNNWKSKTNKLMTTMGTNKPITPKNKMTEDDIEKLFNHVEGTRLKQTKKIKMTTQAVQSWHKCEQKDFVNSVKFLRVDDYQDKLMTGLISNGCDQISEAMIDEMFNDSEKQKNDLTSQFKKNYQVGKVIGQGAYASVRIAIYRPMNKKIAIKIYEKNKIKEVNRKKSIRREIMILQMLNHPNIVKIMDVVETNNHLNIIMEYLNGISLGSYMKSNSGNRIPQKACKKIFRQLTKALKYMHSLNIAHRDIKLENVILDDNNTPKFIDFGFSTCIESSKKIKIFCGTPSYMAPEVVQRKQYRGQTADIWALGVLLFVSLTGIFPYKGSTDQQLYKKINYAEYPKGQLIFHKSASDLLHKMFTINPQKRITASQILKHPWMSTDEQVGIFKKNNEYSIGHRKKINTQESLQKSGYKSKNSKKLLAATYNNNIHKQITLGQQSPSLQKHKQPTSYRKLENNKQNLFKTLKNDKIETKFSKQISNLSGLFSKQLKQKSKIKQKISGIQTHSKIIDFRKLNIDDFLSKSKNKKN